MHGRNWMALIAIVFVASSVTAWAQSDEARASEERQAAEEDAAAEKERGDEGGSETVLIGKFYRQKEKEADNPAVFGTYVSGGRAYLLKVENPIAKPYLIKNERKEIKLAGRIRNEGKYFIVEKVIAPVQLAPPIRNRRGI